MDNALLQGAALPRPADATVLDFIERSVREDPDHTAVVHPAGTLTYREVDQLAHAVAVGLSSAGARPGALVPLLLDDRLALLVAMLGTMKAAAAFVPFDLAWPTERQVTLLGELGATVALGRLPAGATLALGSVTVSTSQSDGIGTPPDLRRPAGQDPIYGFFTSGSTGRPKCAINVHHGLVNRFLSMTEQFADDGAVVLQNSAHTFDSSIWQLLWPLTRGATVVIPDRTSILDFDGTLAEVGRHRVTMTDFVPTIFDLFVERLRARPQDLPLLSSLRQILIGGETVNPRLVRVLRELIPGIRVTNTYGPTEASIGSVFHSVGDDDREVIPLGRPLPNTSVLLLREDVRPTPRGSVGEIYLGGHCVGLGYHGDPARTGKAFVPNPYPEVPGRRLYRTGDFGWLRDDGVLMFSGRRDAQVQVAGVRVDLGEVEASLAGVAGVRQVKVIADGPVPALVCFYSADPPVPAGKLRAHARATLPDGLVPSRFMALDALPLLANGKVDQVRLRRRLALAVPDGGPQATGSPAGSLEAAIAGIWSRVLGFAVTGGDFFRVGGTSLSAARLAVELERAYRVPVSVRDLVYASTIPAQAEFIRGGRFTPAQPADAICAELERFLPSADRREAQRPVPSQPGAVLLAGATGFIGIHLLDALLEATSCPIVCLTRAGDDGSAQDRVDAALARVGRDDGAPRVTALAGDLSADHLGLSDCDWARLCRDIEVIIDAGGLVDTLRDYSALRATHVAGTHTLIRLADEGITKRVISLSTTSVRGGPGAWLPEEFLPRHSPIPADGYSQSKWVAEQLMHAAAARGTAATVVRLGEVAAHSGTGKANPRSLVTMILRLCSRLGARPPTSARVDWTPVNSVARLVAACAATDMSAPGKSHGIVLNAVAPASVSMSELMGRLRSADEPLPEISYREFLDRAARAVGEDDVARCLAVLRPRCPAGTDPLAAVISDAGTGTDTSHASRLAQQLELDWGRPREPEIRNMIAQLVRPSLSVPASRIGPSAYRPENPRPVLEML